MSLARSNKVFRVCKWGVYLAMLGFQLLVLRWLSGDEWWAISLAALVVTLMVYHLANHWVERQLKGLVRRVSHQYKEDQQSE